MTTEQLNAISASMKAGFVAPCATLTEQQFMRLFHDYLDAIQGDWECHEMLFELLTDCKAKWASHGEFACSGDFTVELNDQFIKDWVNNNK